jgi:RimJ/RimL family protein N-acetyltransferase
MLPNRQCEKSTFEKVPARQPACAFPDRGAVPRRLGSEDRGAVLAHLLRLSFHDRQMRFCTAFTDACVERYVANIDFEASACFGIFGERQDLIALVQAFAYDDGAVRMVEAAFSTDTSFRCKGLGTLLFHHVADHAAACGADRVIAQCLARNRPMRALLRAVGAVCSVDDGELTGQMELVGHA